MPSAPLDRATTQFSVAFGGTPDGIWSAPGRVNLIGEHTDYNEGFVLPLAIRQRCVVAAAPAAEDASSATSAQRPAQTVRFRAAGSGKTRRR